MVVLMPAEHNAALVAGSRVLALWHGTEEFCPGSVAASLSQQLPGSLAVRFDGEEKTSGLPEMMGQPVRRAVDALHVIALPT